MSDSSEDEVAITLGRKRKQVSIEDSSDDECEKSQNVAPSSQGPSTITPARSQSVSEEKATADVPMPDDKSKAKSRKRSSPTAPPKKVMKTSPVVELPNEVVIGGGGDHTKNSKAFANFFNIKKAPKKTDSVPKAAEPVQEKQEPIKPVSVEKPPASIKETTTTTSPSSVMSDTIEATEETVPTALSQTSAAPATESSTSTAQSNKPNVFAAMMGGSKSKLAAAVTSPPTTIKSPPTEATVGKGGFFTKVSKSDAVAASPSPTAEAAVDIQQNWSYYGSGKRGADEEEMFTFGSSTFDPVTNALWSPGEKVPYAALALMFEKCESTTKRLKIISYLRDFFRSVIVLSPTYLCDCVYLCVNEVAPAYEGKELGIGEGTLLKALAEATGSTVAHIKEKLREIGDLGAIAEDARSKQKTLIKPMKLTVPFVFGKFKEISELSGSKSGDRRKDMIKQLLVSSVGREARFIARALQGNLRIHMALSTVLRALGEAVVLNPPVYPDIKDDKEGMMEEEVEMEGAEGTEGAEEEEEEEEEDVEVEEKKKTSGKPKTALEKRMMWAHQMVEVAYNQGPSLNRLVSAILKYPLEELRKRCGLVAGLPIKVMLGKPATSIEEVLQKFDGRQITLEYKYDGERAQIHKLEDGTIKIYSRNLEDNTTKYPDVIAFLPDVIKSDVKSFILDAEVVAWDTQEKKILPFQTLSTRKRKDVKNEEVTVQVVLFGFDLLYLNGKSYMRDTFETRRKLMHEHFIETEGKFQYAKHLDTSKVADIDSFLQQAIVDSCEGLMVKPLDKGSWYVPDKRKWIKIKKDYLSGVGDSLDLVPLGAWYGKGKRTGTYGAFLLFCHDDENEEYQSLSKIGTGFTDVDLETLTAQLKDHVIDSPPAYYKYTNTTNMLPDVWFEPAVVWEVLCADLSVSPVYQAAMGKAHDSKGISTRFPRFIRSRPDKQPENATSAEQVAEMYFNQSVVKNNNNGNGRH